MATVHFTDHEGNQTTLEANEGDSVMETAVRNGIEGIVAECGGSLSCATCHVYLDPADAEKVPPMSEMEDEMLYGTTEETTPDCPASSNSVPIPSCMSRPQKPRYKP